MNWTSARAWAGTVARLGLGIVFVVAGWQKLHDPSAFLRAVRAYDVMPDWLNKATAYGLPVLEVCIGVLLVLGLITRAAATVAGILMLVFLVGIIEAAGRGLKLECGCFGGGGTTDGPTSYTLDILRDLGLTVLAVYLVLWPLTRIAVDEYLARNDQVAPPSAKRMRSEQGQRKYNAVLEARKREARTRSRYLVGSLAVLVVLVSVIGIGVQSNRSKIQGSVTASNASVTNGVVLGNKSAKVTVDLFEDFQCPACEQFHTATGADLATLISAGQAQVRIHMVAFLDASSSGNQYSTRAANAGYCASDISPQMFFAYYDYLYSTQKGQPIQPAEGSNGRTDTDLINYAGAVGITGTALTTFQTCVQTEQHKSLVQAATNDWSQRGFTGTPTVLVNGKQLTDLTKASFDAAVLKADPKATAGSTATAYPSPTPSGSSASTGSPAPSGSASVVATPTASP